MTERKFIVVAIVVTTSCCLAILFFSLRTLFVNSKRHLVSDVKVISEGLIDDYVKIEIEVPEDAHEFMAFIEKRKDTTGGVNLFLVDEAAVSGSSVNKVKIEQKSPTRFFLYVDFKWFEDDKLEIWLNGKERLGEWNVQSVGAKNLNEVP